MLAIVGALILIDRMTAYWFTELIVLIMPVVIIMYATMHSLKDGQLLSVGLLIISFLLGNFNLIYMIYVPVGIFTALIYAWGIRKNFDKRRLLLLAVITYTIGEIIATFVVYPLLGFPVSQMLEQYESAMSEAGSYIGIDYVSIFTSAGMNFGKLIGILYVVSTLILGAMEGVLIHLLTIFLLKRFKIKDLGRTNIFDIKPNPIVAYLAMFATCCLFLIRYVDNEILYYVIVLFGICGTIVLLYYGYIFLVLFGVIVLKRNVGGLFILLALLIPSLMIVLLIIGFLYGAGPLRTYLEEKVRERQNEET